MSERCTKTYTVTASIILTCNGHHILGNPFRDKGLVHQSEYMNRSWTWYDSESDKEQR